MEYYTESEVKMQTYTLTDILQNSKIKNVDDLIQNLNAVAELAREDVARIAKAQRLYFADFDSTYTTAVQMFENTIIKRHLEAIKRFIRCNNLENAVHWLIARLLNNMVNITTNQKYNLYASPKFRDFDKNSFYDNNELKKIEDELTLEKLDKQTIKIGLKKVWEDAISDKEFDLQDFEDLCCKYGFEMMAVLGYDPNKAPVVKIEKTESGHSQFVLFFDPIEDQDVNYNKKDKKEWGAA